MLTDTLKSTCHPFAANTPSDLVNISTGKAASSETTYYLLSTFQRGNEARHKFERECLTDSTRFMKTLSRIDIKNIKRKTMESRKLNVEEGDIFARLLTLAARESKAIDLHHILCYPITDVSLSLAHADGTPLKTEKASLTKLLESKQTSVLTNINLLSISCSIIDGGLILYEVLVQHTTSSYVDIATELLARVCSLQGMEIHLFLDKYKSPFIDNGRKLRCRTEEVFIIIRPQQIQKQPRVNLVKKNCSFKEEFSKFVLSEWKKSKYGSIIKDKKKLCFSWWKMCAIST